jgi:hypothetical protein
MSITPVTHASAAAHSVQVSPTNVSGSVLKAASNDGDGRTGTAALNDGDAAAQAARRQAVNIKA